VAEQKYEDAFQKLESIVKKLEDGNLSLEESLKAFEEGVRLSRFCSKKLDEAEKKVEILLKKKRWTSRSQGILLRGRGGLS